MQHSYHSTAFLLADDRLPVLAPDVVELGAVVVEGDVEGGDTPLLVTTIRLRAVHAVDWPENIQGNVKNNRYHLKIFYQG